ncbi:hypothetical protein LHYA1_G007581 [Lachnellula hyalina]|uniref:Hemerythrin-like domain-containing protein n=1 Tax=Lachnellula hyalina TaxID=1316788 RepID=A0A8H8TX03_9HELO|nr:uncharacterized protein LHYA1_G007581 [Lachnellula hyalina]TVY23815.1 hypothetical protein LHYA1_G007581 [Lachnellula hyalina]
MGQKSANITKQWADSPFALIETPRKRHGITDPSKAHGAINAATEMCLVHNVLIRHLNCIYLQAPNVKLDKDIADFATFIHAWCVILEGHHHTEETLFFPWLEDYIGIKDHMGKNIEQHHAFHPGLKELDDYATGLTAGKETYDGANVRKIIDNFGPILAQHLKEEVESLEALEEFGDKIDWVTWGKRVSDHAVKHGDTDIGIPMFVTNIDYSFEAPIHVTVWPPWPWVAGVLFRWVYIRKRKAVCRFSSCDSYGMPKELEFV